MKHVDIDNSQLQYILVDALYSTPPCVRYTTSFYSNCQEHDWSFKNVAGNIQITGSIVEKLSDYMQEQKNMSYTETLRLAISLGIQIEILQDFGFGITHFSIQDILVINKNWFLITNLANITDITNHRTLKIIKPLSDESFLAPELRAITVLPSEVDISCAYYSLAMLCVKLYGFKMLKDAEKYDLEIINHTPLYYLLKRCLEKDPNDRNFLLI